MAGPSEGGGMLEVVGARRRDVLTAGDVAETERDALGNVSEGAGPLAEAVDVHCDSVHLTVCDDETGHGGGQVGFHRGHLPAVLALGDGPADALLHGEAVFHTVVHGGFASVRNDVIRIITDSAVETEEKSDTENED